MKFNLEFRGIIIERRDAPIAQLSVEQPHSELGPDFDALDLKQMTITPTLEPNSTPRPHKILFLQNNQVHRGYSI
jgi:hypothetical protein